MKKGSKQYPELLGSYCWLANTTRPNIAYTVSKFASLLMKQPYKI